MPLNLHIPTPHCARIAVTFTHAHAAVNCEMTFALQDTTDGIFTTPSVVATNVWAAWVANCVPALSPNVVSNGVVYEDVRTVPYTGADYPQTATPGTLASASTQIPTDTALTIKRLGGALGRAGRGRVYWPLWDQEELLTADATSSAVQTRIQNALGAFQTQVETLSGTTFLGHISLQFNKVARTNGLFYRTTSWVAADLLIDSQRRRLAGRGS